MILEDIFATSGGALPGSCQRASSLFNATSVALTTFILSRVLVFLSPGYKDSVLEPQRKEDTTAAFLLSQLIYVSKDRTTDPLQPCHCLLEALSKAVERHHHFQPARISLCRRSLFSSLSLKRALRLSSLSRYLPFSPYLLTLPSLLLFITKNALGSRS